MNAALLKISFLVFILQVTAAGMDLYPQSLPFDRVIDTVRCKAVAGQSYSLYLPPRYDNRKSCPVILIFDPAASGRTGVNAFMEAGRKYGFILACSNNARNGPMEDNFTAAAAMQQDIYDRFHVDQKRIYVSGFSGGSRFALALAVKDRRISGVIGCGAGLPGDRYYFPSSNSDFLYYGLAGNRDMNYLEMYDLEGFFSSQTRVTEYFRPFDGKHEWPGPGLLTEAVEWLILQAMNRKIIEPDTGFISVSEKKAQKLIDEQVSSGNKFDAVMYMRFAARDFQGTAFGSGAARLLAETEKSAEYQKAVRKWSGMAETEQQKKEKYMNYLMSVVRSGSLPDTALSWWKHETSDLVRLRDKGSSGDSRMASRVLNFISILCYEQGMGYYRSRHFDQAAVLFEVCTLSDSENPNNYYNLAKARAGTGKKKETLDALTDAVKFGFNSRKTVEADPAFVPVRNEERYKALLSKLK